MTPTERTALASVRSKGIQVLEDGSLLWGTTDSLGHSSVNEFLTIYTDRPGEVVGFHLKRINELWFFAATEMAKRAVGGET